MSTPTAGKVIVQFHPQVWVGDYAYPEIPQGPTTWEVDASDVQNIEPDSYESDDLRHHSNAPAWVKDWCGPFFITWEEEQ